MGTNPKTNLLGILTLFLGLASIWLPASYQQKVQATATVLAGGGLLAAKDSNKN